MYVVTVSCHAGLTPEVYYRRVPFIPFLEQLESRFSATSAKSLVSMKLLSGKTVSEEDVANLEEIFDEDLQTPGSLHAEVRIWRLNRKCADS